MKVAYFDCFSGIAGDMLLAALLDAGLPAEFLRGVVARLNLPGVSLGFEKVKRGGIAATHVVVHVPPEAQKKHRHLPQILKIIDESGVSDAAKTRAAAVFRKLAEAEAAVHDTTVEKVHFHEVGAVDAIVDIVGACTGLAELGVERVICSPIPTGSGTVTCEHGVMPVPAPATAMLLRGVPLAACEEPGELTTPTGAALAVTLAESFGPPPSMVLRAAGIGAGTREGRTQANIFRLLLGETGGAAAGRSGPAADDGREGLDQDEVTLLEAQVDDATGQSLAFACESLLAAGAVDAYLVPILMKKGRPGQLLTVLARPTDAARLEDLIFRSTTTFGVRRTTAARAKLRREIVRVETPFGPIGIKVGRRGAQVLRVWPEYDECAAAALRHGVSLEQVQQAALRQWHEHDGGRRMDG